MDEPFLAEQWRAAHADLGLAPDGKTLASLLEAWGGAGRFYHATPHLAHGLRHLEAAGPAAAPVRLAWFFHDAVYVVGAADNEALSAVWFGDYATERGLDAERVARGRTLILATRDHQGAASDDPLWPLMNDADLAVFAAPADVYRAYAENVWREYSAIVARPAFVAGRAAFMSAFRSRPIFLTPAMRDAEAVAHANIDAEVAALRAEAGPQP